MNELDTNPELALVADVSYGRLIYLRFRKNRLAVVSFWVLLFIYLMALLAGFIAPHDPHERYLDSITAPPQPPHFVDAEGHFHLQPFVYGLTVERDPYTFERIYELDETKRYPIQFFVRGTTYKLLFFDTDIHLFGVEGTGYFPLGTDTQGRDFFSRLVYGGQVSSVVGLLGVTLSLTFGITLGMLSGYFGGIIDTVVQRAIEIILSFPTIPLWLALTASFPADWSPLRVFFYITIILSLIGWGRLARIVRGMTLSLKHEEYILAARMSGGGTWWIIRRHLFPANLSYIIVATTLAIPGMIIGETALSFLGLGLRFPIVSWGVLLRDAQQVRVISHYPWLMFPIIPVALTVLSFNFVGDGLRDAIDPHSKF